MGGGEIDQHFGAQNSDDDNNIVIGLLFIIWTFEKR